MRKNCTTKLLFEFSGTLLLFVAIRSSKKTIKKAEWCKKLVDKKLEQKYQFICKLT